MYETGGKGMIRSENVPESPDATAGLLRCMPKACNSETRAIFKIADCKPAGQTLCRGGFSTVWRDSFASMHW